MGHIETGTVKVVTEWIEIFKVPKEALANLKFLFQQKQPSKMKAK